MLKISDLFAFRACSIHEAICFVTRSCPCILNFIPNTYRSALCAYRYPPRNARLIVHTHKTTTVDLELDSLLLSRTHRAEGSLHNHQGHDLI